MQYGKYIYIYNSWCIQTSGTEVLYGTMYAVVYIYIYVYVCTYIYMCVCIIIYIYCDRVVEVVYRQCIGSNYVEYIELQVESIQNMKLLGIWIYTHTEFT